MNIRKTMLALSVAAAATPAAFGGNFVGGELGWDSHPASGPVTREQVRRDYSAFRAHPVYSDGTVMIQGEAGHVPASQGASADTVPSGPHTHALGNAAAPGAAAAPLTGTQLRAYREQYIN